MKKLSILKKIFHSHKWIMITPSERKCTICKKHQARVMYPFESSLIFWENKNLYK